MKTFKWEKVSVGQPNDCWPWKGAPNTWGYGDCLWNGKRSNASRAAYEITYGKVAEGLVVCHRCDNPICCNQKHLFAATQAENLADCRRKGRQVYRFGEDHHRCMAKMNEDDVRQARQLYASGISQSEIGRSFGIHSSVISRAVRGESWKHVK